MTIWWVASLTPPLKNPGHAPDFDRVVIDDAIITELKKPKELERSSIRDLVPSLYVSSPP